MGDKNLQVAHADNLNNIINITIINNKNTENSRIVKSDFSLNIEYYSLFVIDDEIFNDEYFFIEKERSLTISEGVSPDIFNRFARLNENAILQIKTFPSLFASENHQYGRTDSDHQAYFGIVNDIKIQENSLKIYFQKLSSIPQQRLNEIAPNLAIKGSSFLNELNRTHWTIKKINLVKELCDAGFKGIISA